MEPTSEHASLESALQHVRMLGQRQHSFLVELRDPASRRVLLSVVDQTQHRATDEFGFAVVFSNATLAYFPENDSGREEVISKLGLLGFEDYGDDCSTTFTRFCGGDTIATGQLVQSVLREVYGRSLGEPVAISTTDHGPVSTLLRYRWLVLQAVRRRHAVLPDSPLIKDFLARDIPLRRQFQTASHRNERLAAAQGEYFELENLIRQRHTELVSSDAAIDKLAPHLGKVAFIANRAGHLPRTPDFDERIAHYEHMEKLQAEHRALAVDPGAGFLAKTKAAAQQLAITGKLKFEELRVSGIETSLGRKLIASNRDAELASPETAAVLAELRTLREIRQTRARAVEEAQAHLEARKQAWSLELNVVFTGSGRELAIAIQESQNHHQAVVAQLKAMEEQFVNQLLYEAAIEPGTPLGDLMGRIRELTRQSETQASRPPEPLKRPALSLDSLKAAVTQPSQLQSTVGAKLSELTAAVNKPVADEPSIMSVLDATLTGNANPAAYETLFARCRNALGMNGVESSSLKLLFNTGNASSLPGGPAWHLALTDQEWLQIAVADGVPVEIRRRDIEAVSLEWKPRANNYDGACDWSCEVVADAPLHGTFAAGDQAAFVAAVVGNALLNVGTSLFHQGAYLRAEMVLSRVAADCPSTPAMAKLVEAMGRGPRVSVTFQRTAGELEDEDADDGAAISGYLQLDTLGLEFTPWPYESAHYLRIAPHRVLNFAQKTGQFPAAMIKAAQSKRAAGSALRSASRLATMFIDDPMLDMGTRIAGQAASSALKNSGNLGPRPQNRIVMLVNDDGEKRRLHFDTNGKSREELEQAASQFCAQAEAFRDRLGRNATKAKKLEQPADPESKRSTASPQPSTAVPAPESPLDKLPEKLREKPVEAPAPEAPAPGAPAPESSAPMHTPKVVGCPKCGAKLRVGKPGIVGCPKCNTKIRVADALFNSERTDA